MREPVTADWHRLVVDNLPLTQWAVDKWVKGMDRFREDLVGVATVALIRAARGFDPSKGFKFSTFAIWLIKRELLHECGKLQKTPAVATLGGDHETDGGLDLVWIKQWEIANRETDLSAEAHVQCEETIREARLTAREAEVMRMVGMGNDTTGSYAKVLGVSRNRVYEIYAKALKKCRSVVEVA